MPKPYIPISECIDIAKVSQYLSSDARAKQLAFSNGFVNTNTPSLIRVVRESLEWAYNRNNNDLTLIDVSNYLYSICDYANQAQVVLGLAEQAGEAPVFTLQPTNISQQEGTSASLTVTASGTPIIIYQWQKYNGTSYDNIAGANQAALSFTNLQPSDNGTYRCIAFNAYGTATSNTATIAVGVQLTCYYAYTVGDPYPAISGGNDQLTYQVSKQFNNGDTSISLTLPLAGETNNYGTFKIPTGQPLKTAWYNTAFDNGQIPDSVWRDPITLNGFDYYITRIQFTYTSGSPLIFS